ncbi:MAG: type I restriction endonuclease [Thermaerobacter sp.]|nr:type I restriction endonuclease [Thermaerobacter sp.]
MSPGIAESDVEKAVLEWFAGLGYDVAHGPDLVSGADAAERRGYADVVLAGRLRAALDRLNPDVPPEALEDAFRKVMHSESAVLAVNNHAFHRMLTDGVQVEHRVADGRVMGDRVRLVDFEQPEANDWVVTNQFTVVEGRRKRRADVVVFVNGLPLAVVELKDPSDEQATVWNAFNQIQTYKNDIPSLFAYNEVLVISDGLEARVGSLTADRERFMPWRTIEGEDLAPPGLPQLQVAIQGVFERSRFLDLLRHFIVFETDGPDVVKKLAGYHQFHAVNRAVEETIRAARLRAGYGMAAEREPAYEAGARIGSEAGDRRIGVVWHTQGSGKSLTMAFYAGKVVQHPAMANPTIVVLTDRNDLDLTFANIKR